MTLSQITMGTHPLGTGTSSPARITSTLDSRVLAGKGKIVPSRQWADEPWPLIEPPSRTRRVCLAFFTLSFPFLHSHTHPYTYLFSSTLSSIRPYQSKPLHIPAKIYANHIYI